MNRERLPNRRPALTFDFEHAGLKYTATVGRFPDGRIAEVFVQNHKSNSGADVNARDAAIILSFALQHGADVLAISKALCRDPRGKPSGVIGAVLDLIAGSSS
jgi:ribonucleoside-diphosphate reductase alpha chain